jgi:hypothetical protein
MIANEEDRRIRRQIKAWISNLEPPADGWPRIENHFRRQASKSAISRRMGMFSINPYILEQFWRERQKEFLSDAEQYHLAEPASKSQGRLARLYDKVLAAFGNLLVDWGVRLQGRKRGTIKYSGPIVRRSTNACQNVARCSSGFKGGGIF